MWQRNYSYSNSWMVFLKEKIFLKSPIYFFPFFGLQMVCCAYVSFQSFIQTRYLHFTIPWALTDVTLVSDMTLQSRNTTYKLLMYRYMLLSGTKKSTYITNQIIDFSRSRGISTLFWIRCPVQFEKCFFFQIRFNDVCTIFLSDVSIRMWECEIRKVWMERSSHFLELFQIL